MAFSGEKPDRDIVSNSGSNIQETPGEKLGQRRDHGTYINGKEDVTVEHVCGDDKSHKSGDNESGDSNTTATEDDNEHDEDGGNPSLDVSPSQQLQSPQSPARAASVFSRNPQAVIVARSERRGLFGRFAVIPEVERPYDYTNKTKWTITAIIALAAGAGPMGSAIFYPALPQMAVDLQTTPTTTNLAVAFYMLAMSIFPLWWSSFSETLGRRTIYLISFTLFVLFAVLCANSVNVAMLIVMRIFSGGAAASVLAVGAGTIADIWEPANRGRAMGIFYLGPLTGPLFAPIVGGGLAQALGWRSTMWFLSIYGSVTLLLIFFCLPETLPKRNPKPKSKVPTGAMIEQGLGLGQANNANGANALSRTTTTQSVKDQTKKAGKVVKRFIIDPLQVLLYLRFPPVLVTVYSAAIAFGSVFVVNISIQSAFSQAPYNFPEVLVGLLYIPSSIGYILASTFGGRWIDRIMAREAQKAGRYDEAGKLIFLPEDRMRENMWLAATLYPGALILYGWTAEKGVHWIVPSIANFFFGFGSMLIFGVVTTMLTEFMPNRSSGGVAVNNFVRNIFSCLGGVVTQPLIDAMGHGWVCTMVGLFAWITGNLAIWALRRRAPAWRVTMDRKLNKGGS